ncbi:MAG: PorT family protein [Bacteroidetes bacterium]|nr:PorT family protein [Bacteroidota bacterium]
MKNNLLLIATLSSFGLLCSGCLEVRDMHHDAVVSVDRATGHYTGDSPRRFDNTTGENVGWLMSEAFTTGTGTGSFGSSPKFDQPDPLGETPAGGPSDGRRQGDYSFTPAPVAVPANAYFSLSEELELVAKGFSVAPTNGVGSEADHLYYLEIPVLVNYNMKLDGGHELRFGLGPYVAAALFGHYSGNYGGTQSSGSLTFGSEGDYARTDYGVVLNAGFMITPKISVALNYDWGLRNIYAPGDNTYNRSIGLNLGYRIK